MVGSLTPGSPQRTICISKPVFLSSVVHRTTLLLVCSNVFMTFGGSRVPV